MPFSVERATNRTSFSDLPVEIQANIFARTTNTSFRPSSNVRYDRSSSARLNHTPRPNLPLPENGSSEFFGLPPTSGLFDAIISEERYYLQNITILSPQVRRTSPDDLSTYSHNALSVLLPNIRLSEEFGEQVSEVISRLSSVNDALSFPLNINMVSSTSRQPLKKAVGAWLCATQAEQWQAFRSEDGAASFSLFLNRLSRAVGCTDAAFRDDVRRELSYLAITPP